MSYKLAFLSCYLLAVSCSTPEETASYPILDGSWRITFDIQEHSLPVNAEFQYGPNHSLLVSIKNGEEIISSEVNLHGDSITIQMPYFNSSLRLFIESPELMTGTYINHNKSDYHINLIAEHGQSFRFTPTSTSTSIPLQYRVKFLDSGHSDYDAILHLNNEKGSLEGTFRTETGDYRFLQGNIMNERIYLSTFDGAHLFYFQATIQGDSLIDGVFKSGIHYTSHWSGVADTLFQLQHPDSLTYLTNPEAIIDFKFLHSNGDSVSWDDLNLEKKVVILDIMGSWCPNCLDANNALFQLASKYSHEELCILPIAFEYTEKLEVAKSRIERAIGAEHFQNGFLFGGKASKVEASNAFPMLNGISSFPTIIVVDKDRRIQLIHTGFNGPGTGIHYELFLKKMDDLLLKLISNKS